MDTGKHHCGGIVLCGGRSSRMGLPKATLPFGPELLLQRVVRLLTSAVEPIVVVAAADQELPALPREVLVARDVQAHRGPLAALAGGLAALGERVDAAYLTGCDAPFLSPAFVRRVIELLGDYDVAVPRTAGFHHSLAAVYRRRVLPEIEALLAADLLRPPFLFERVRTREIWPGELTGVDAELRSLENINTPEEYLAALARAGFEVSEEVRRLLSSSGGGHAP